MLFAWAPSDEDECSSISERSHALRGPHEFFGRVGDVLAGRFPERGPSEHVEDQIFDGFSIAPAWRRAWAEAIPFFAFDPAIRKIIYTADAVESLNRVIRKSIKTRGPFPTEDAATKLIYPAIRNF
jgi:hypothetical protein